MELALLGEVYQMDRLKKRLKDKLQRLLKAKIRIDKKEFLLMKFRSQATCLYDLEEINRELYYLNRRKEVIKWLSGFDVKFHLTITLGKDMKEWQAERYVNSLLKMIRNNYFGSNRKRDYLKGQVIRETKKDNSRHYHILIFDHPVFKAKRNRVKQFLQVLRSKCERIIEKYVDRNGRARGYNPINPTRGLHLQDYFEGGLEEYLTKNLEYIRLDFDFIEPLTYDGFSFTDKSYERPFSHRSYHDESLDGDIEHLTEQEYFKRKKSERVGSNAHKF